MQRNNGNNENERTNKVLEKWGAENGELNQEEIQKAAEMFAKIKVKNRLLKKVAILGVVFMLAFLGLMLGSVILGAEVSKDFKVKNEVLVQRTGNGSALQTSEMFYSVDLNLLTPLSVLKGLKSLKFYNKEDGSIIQFNVVSFYYVHGRNLTIYGQTYMANVLGNGEIEFYPISNVNGRRSIDESRIVKKSSDNGDLQAMSNNGNGNNPSVTRIYDCNGLRNIGSNGKYALMNNINCYLSQPLLSNGFYGIFNGRGYTITLNMNRNGPVALFYKLRSGAVIGNLYISGNLNGKGNCSAFAVEAYTGSKFLSSAVYATITCGNANNDPDDYTNMGGFAAVLRNPTNSNGAVSFQYSVTQGFLNSVSTNVNKTSYTGAFYGRMGSAEYMNRKFNFTYSASNFTRYGNHSHVNRFGYKYVFVNAQPPTTSPGRNDIVNPTTNERSYEKRDPYIPEDCYNFDDTNLDFINMCIEWYLIWWFENYDCCFDFNSCPYVNCTLYVNVCTYCQHRKNLDAKRKKDGETEPSDSEVSQGPVGNITPTVQKICGFDDSN